MKWWLSVCGVTAAWAVLLPKAEFPSGYAWGCLNVSKGLPFCDPSLPTATRVNDLVGRLNLTEKIGLMSPDVNRTGVAACSFMDAGVKRLGIPSYFHLTETNTVVADSCLTPYKCPTTFSGPMGLAGSFNRTLWRAKGAVIALELRAFNNLGWHRTFGNQFTSGLDGFGPNINILRDPRFGRESELPGVARSMTTPCIPTLRAGEDPFLTGSYAMEMVRGCQEGPDPKYLFIVAGLKHYDAYSDTYLPQYRMGFEPELGNAKATMCSYAGVNGAYACANPYLLNTVIREKFRRPDVIVGTDCGALTHMVVEAQWAPDPQHASAWALNAGLDMELGDQYWSSVPAGGINALEDAIKMGLTTEEKVTTAVSRVVEKRFLLGQFDPLENQVYTSYGSESVNSSESQTLNSDGTLQSLILLKNENGILPFADGKRLAVVGPLAFSTMGLVSDYAMDLQCYTPDPTRAGGTDCLETMEQAFRRLHGEHLTHTAPGVDVESSNRSGISLALAAVQASDQIVLVLGDTYNQEHEDKDRNVTTLPGLQEEFAFKVLEAAAGKPVVLVILSGGIMSIDNFIDDTQGIIHAFHPGPMGPVALFRSIFGLANRWGRLSATVYPASYVREISMYDFSMSEGPGRTYRYYKGEPLFEFGYGLSYTSFTVTCDSVKPSKANTTSIRCLVENVGGMDGDDVLMVYHRVSEDIRKAAKHPVPTRSLVDFERVGIGADDHVLVDFTVYWESLALTTLNGDKVLYEGAHYLDVSDGTGTSPSVISVYIATRRVIDMAPRP